MSNQNIVPSMANINIIDSNVLCASSGIRNGLPVFSDMSALEIFRLLAVNFNTGNFFSSKQNYKPAVHLPAPLLS